MSELRKKHPEQVGLQQKIKPADITVVVKVRLCRMAFDDLDYLRKDQHRGVYLSCLLMKERKRQAALEAERGS